jgi:subtilisin family serine protease
MMLHRAIGLRFAAAFLLSALLLANTLAGLAALPSRQGQAFKASGIWGESRLSQDWQNTWAQKTRTTDKNLETMRMSAWPMLMNTPLRPEVTTEGLAVINGPAWHAAGFQGAGVKVGIIDGGFAGYPGLLGSDLPAAVTVKNFVDGEIDAQVDGTTPHGTACAEIIHDLAPQATLYLAKINTDVDLQEAVAWLKDVQHVNIILTSQAWYNLAPGDGTGELAILAQEARNAGILWVAAAGDARTSHWGGLFSDTDGDRYLEYFDDQNIDYFVDEEGMPYEVPEGTLIRAYLRWDDWTNVEQDYDLYLMRWIGFAWQMVASSTNPQDGLPGQKPMEAVEYVTTSSTSRYGLAIYRHSSDRVVNFELFAPGVASLDESVPARSLTSLADAPGVMTAAAVDVNSPYLQETYSSEGPTNGPGGAETGGFTKPDISGYANVSTQSYPGAGPKFSGTSAAAAHVAGAAALVLSAAPTYTPAQVQAYLQANAIDMGAPGMDNVFGYGRLYLGDPASILNTPPTLSGLPDLVFLEGSVADPAIDLWSYAQDAETPVGQLVFTIDNTPDPNAGVEIVNNRSIRIAPAASWAGETEVVVRVADSGGLSVTDAFQVSIVSVWNGNIFLPLVTR